MWFGFCSSVLLSPIETKAIEECIEILTKAQWASKFSISGHVSSSFTINPFNQRATDSAPVHPLIVTTYTCIALGDSSQSPLKQRTRCLCIPSIQCKQCFSVLGVLAECFSTASLSMFKVLESSQYLLASYSLGLMQVSLFLLIKLPFRRGERLERVDAGRWEKHAGVETFFSETLR